MAAERQRLKEESLRSKNWKRWGPYLSERQWGTVREDYSHDGNCWNSFSHDDARSRAYRWGEDGLLGICDRECRLCLSLALWNTHDPILKERLFGLTGHQGNHGEDVKELYYYLDSTPTHSYMAALYKYPQAAFPYERLIHENLERQVKDPEFELLDTGLFDHGDYFDVKAEYCKSSPNSILVRYTINNCSDHAATLHVLPTIWFRNVWAWGEDCYCYVEPKPFMRKIDDRKVTCFHPSLGLSQTINKRRGSTNIEETPAPGNFIFEADVGPNGEKPTLLFTENDTNFQRLYNIPNKTKYVKDAFHNYVIKGDVSAVNPNEEGTKCVAYYVLNLQASQEVVLKLRLYYEKEAPKQPFGTTDFDTVFLQRLEEADAYYREIIPNRIKAERDIVRQAYAGLLWSKQFYYYNIEEWLRGDSTQPPPPGARLMGRNSEWTHLFNRDIISVPDKWEYPWYASWDLAFHMIPMSTVDSVFAKDQLVLFLREWYMHPNGQIPAYEFAFDDVNPPVHAYSCLKVYKSSAPKGKRDIVFLARCFHKLVLNFTWWINRKDVEGKNLFSGGFLGLDNIGVFDRSKPLPTGGYLKQADATAWMAFFCVIMLEISLILARHDPIYEDMASKFFEHFVAIADAINSRDGIGLWNEADGFYYDHVKHGHNTYPMKILSMVGVVPLFSCLVLKDSEMRNHAEFYKRTKWFMKHKKDLAKHISLMVQDDKDEYLLLALVKKEQLIQVLRHLLNEDEFLSPFGIRSLSKHHKENPFVINTETGSFGVSYEPGESESKMFGGNSNWRGPIWFPLNYLLIENLHRYDYFYGNSLKVECPTGSGNYMRLKEVAYNLSLRLAKLFLPGSTGMRPCHGMDERYAKDPNFKDLILFYEYFHGDSGRGCGASHQTGWTALIANVLQQIHKSNMYKDTSLCDISSEGEY